MSAPPIAAPYLAAVGVLAFAGLTKIARPETTVRALRLSGMPATRSTVRAGAVAELLVAVAALVFPGALTGALVAVSYAAFASFIAIALRNKWPLASCGCFGKPDTLPTRLHAVLDVGAAVCAAWWAVVGPANLPRMFSSQPWNGVPLGLLAAVIALLAYIVWTNPLPSATNWARR